MPRAGARFCDACGAPLLAVEFDAEHKQVTVLFADVVRSMDLAAQLGPERLRELMSELFNRCGAVTQRYGGMVDKFTGDGIMALFGAPIAMEDHAIRACIAALEIQREAVGLADEARRRDGVAISVRVGLNSGDVVVGQIGPSRSTYTAVGEQVGLAQRMESAAPPGGVMVSEATARLVEHLTVLGPPAMYRIKGSAEPVPARVLHGITTASTVAGRRETALVGRDDEMAVIAGLLDRLRDGQGSAVAISGPAGIGKSRVCRELLKLSQLAEAETFWTFCESHTRDVAFRVVARLVRAFFGIAEMDAASARVALRRRLPSAQPEDLVLLDDLVGIRDQAVPDPAVSAEARRRRLSALLGGAASSRDRPAVFVVEDAHWIDDASDSTLAGFLSTVLGMAAAVVVTFRPEYDGALSRLPHLSRLELAPLDAPAATAIATELIGADPSVRSLTERIIESAAGNPFYVQEIVREFGERGVIVGERGAYRRQRHVDDVSVPPTLQATIGARIDRLSPSAKRVLNAAAVVGQRFRPHLLTVVMGEGRDPPAEALAELVHSELIDQVTFIPQAEYVFRHPLIQTVAHEAQLKHARDEMHRRLAAAIHTGDPSGADENAGLIAAHLEAAGDAHAAVQWLLRAAAWFTNRDINAARAGWQRARLLADGLPADDGDRGWMRALPTAMLCASTWRAGGGVPHAEFEDLKAVCSAGNLQVLLAIGMAGQLSGLAVHARIDDACRMRPEYIALVDAIGEPTLTVGLLYPAIHASYEAGAMRDVLSLSQRVIDLADGDPVKGNFLTGSPLAFATAMYATAKCALGEKDWRGEYDRAVDISRVDPTTYVSAVMFKYVSGVTFGALLPDLTAIGETAEAMRVAERCSEEFALHMAQLACGVTNIAAGRDDPTGIELLREARLAATSERFLLTVVPVIDLFVATATLRCGDVDGAIDLARSAVQTVRRTGGLLYLGAATGVLVDALVCRRGAADVDEAEAAASSLAALATDPDNLLYTLPLMEIKARIALVRGDDAFSRAADRYLAAAAAAGFQGHLGRARAMV